MFEEIYLNLYFLVHNVCPTCWIVCGNVWSNMLSSSVKQQQPWRVHEALVSFKRCFLELFKQFPSLWKIKSEKYNNRIFKIKVLKKISLQKTDFYLHTRESFPCWYGISHSSVFFLFFFMHDISFSISFARYQEKICLVTYKRPDNYFQAVAVQFNSIIITNDILLHHLA